MKPKLDAAYMDAVKSVHRSGGSPQIECRNCGAKFAYKPTPIFKQFCSASCRVKYGRAARKTAIDNQERVC